MSDSTATPTTPTVNNDPPAFKDASAPFDNPDADVILRSSDNVDFRVFKVFLSKASPVFKDMFKLPQTPTGQNDDDTKDGLPIVQMAEGSKTIETILTMCYPMTLVDPMVAAPEELEDVKLLLEAAIKYDIATVEERARTWLVAPCFLKTDPVMVYVIACQWNLEKEARAAARFTIGHTILEKPLEKEFDMMTIREFRALLLYVGRCNAAMAKYAINFEFVYSNHGFGCELCGISGSVTRNFSKWLEHYLQSVTEAVINDTWNTKERNRLAEAAIQDARRCSSCRTKTPAKVEEFRDFLLGKMNKIISDVALDFQRR